MDEEVLPAINECWEQAQLPWPLLRRLAELGLVGEDIEGYGCPAMSPLAARTGVTWSCTAATAPAMARLEAIGAFALTEPRHGPDSVALETTARRDGNHWVIDGEKRWIANASIADVVVVWARSQEDGQVKGFLVETASRMLAEFWYRPEARVPGGLWATPWRPVTQR